MIDEALKESINFDKITYKDTKILSNFISDQGKIIPRRVTGLNSKEQIKINQNGTCGCSIAVCYR